MKELIERLEKAEAGSRELDWAIRGHLGLVEIPIEVVFGRNDGCWARRVDEQIIDIGSFMDSGATSSDVYLPRYTTSVDAALTLVPDEWTAWEVASRGGKRKFRAEVSRLRDPSDYGSEEGEYGHASTPALALCIAALKARSQS